ncbi:hypothetical protein CABS01_15947 [Colletotrichum abscissum]|uniref:Uncharacterized protein n=2 Tax=Colletotrichum acutatum species complex TaxID=2707335 RepID=A0A9Q8T2A4_9PEZI|nr:hypothetical protein CSPX01_09391 [Colletotrichum filicis]KAK1474251.1 hypothetical protein CABS01_15947 [Colletotrichum abscissum]KAK1483949.1 hypothetical protein CTAM01_13174 [Colletotrichum tamarilloi]UQC87588.1 hypothetical protein CLUP02_13105 [Colletotrichum lupini]
MSWCMALGQGVRPDGMDRLTGNP